MGHVASHTAIALVCLVILSVNPLRLPVGWRGSTQPLVGQPYIPPTELGLKKLSKRQGGEEEGENGWRVREEARKQGAAAAVKWLGDGAACSYGAPIAGHWPNMLNIAFTLVTSRIMRMEHNPLPSQ